MGGPEPGPAYAPTLPRPHNRFSRARPSPPDLTRDLERQAELALLVVDGDLVTVVGARKAALGAQAEILERDVLRGRFDAALEIVLRLERGHLRADQPEHHLLALRHETQGLEAAGAIGVVLQEERVHVEPGEDRLGDGVVAAARHPGGLEVAPARVDGYRDVARDVAQRRVDLVSVEVR